MIEIKVTGTNKTEIVAQMSGLLASMVTDMMNVPDLKTAEPAVETQLDLPYENTKTKTTKAKTTAIKDVAPVKTQEETDAEAMWGTTPEVVEELSVEGVKTLVKKVAAAKDLKAAVRVLAAVGLKSVTEVKPQHLVKLNEACLAELS